LNFPYNSIVPADCKAKGEATSLCSLSFGEALFLSRMGRIDCVLRGFYPKKFAIIPALLKTFLVNRMVEIHKRKRFQERFFDPLWDL
jgi:hypothetical protein